MILRNLKTLDGRTTDLFFHSQAQCSENKVELQFDKAIAFPGLINSHDHLDFNLFPALGDRVYANYTEWGRHIHQQYKNEIRKILSIPIQLRSQWGVYKNLLCGVTTVVNHGARLSIPLPLINVYQHAQSLHSVKFEKFWKPRLNNPFHIHRKCVVHTGEGTDEMSSEEIDQLIKWNYLQREIIGVHAIAMTAKQSDDFKAIVWCPLSNSFLYNATASIGRLNTKILFGTDSTLTGSWNFWDHLRFAKNEAGVTSQELLDMITINAREVWGLAGDDTMQKMPADIVIAVNREMNALNGFFELNPESILLVVHKGRIRLFDEALYTPLARAGLEIQKFSRISINGKTKFVQGDLPALMKEIRRYNPGTSFPVREIA